MFFFLSRQPVGDFVPRLVAPFFRRKKRFFYFADRQAFLGCVWKRERMWGTQNAAQASQRPATSSEFMIPKDSAIWAATWEREKMRRFRRERRYKSNYFTHTAQQVSFMPTFDNMSLQKFKSPATPKPGSGLDVRVLRVSQLHAVLSVSATAQGWRSAYFTTQGLPLNVMIAWLLMSHLRWGCTWLALPREKKLEQMCPVTGIWSALSKKCNAPKNRYRERRYKSIYESHPLCNPGEVGAVCACFERQWHAVRNKVFATATPGNRAPGFYLSAAAATTQQQLLPILVFLDRPPQPRKVSLATLLVRSPIHSFTHVTTGKMLRSKSTNIPSFARRRHPGSSRN